MAAIRWKIMQIAVEKGSEGLPSLAQTIDQTTLAERPILQIPEQGIPVRAHLKRRVLSTCKKCEYCEIVVEIVSHGEERGTQLHIPRAHHDQTAKAIYNAICATSATQGKNHRCRKPHWPFRPKHPEGLRNGNELCCVKWCRARKQQYSKPDIAWIQGGTVVIIETGCPCDKWISCKRLELAPVVIGKSCVTTNQCRKSQLQCEIKAHWPQKIATVETM